MNILSIDPGDRTGLAVYNTNFDAFESWEMDDIDEMLDMVYEETLVKAYDLVIIENFNIRPTTHLLKKPKRWPIEMVGAVRFICRINDVKLAIQQPAEKDWMTDDKLKRLGWYKGSKAKNETAGHADDAARHIGVYLGVKKYNKDFLRRLV